MRQIVYDFRKFEDALEVGAALVNHGWAVVLAFVDHHYQITATFPF